MKVAEHVQSQKVHNMSFDLLREKEPLDFNSISSLKFSAGFNCISLSDFNDYYLERSLACYDIQY